MPEGFITRIAGYCRCHLGVLSESKRYEVQSITGGGRKITRGWVGHNRQSPHGGQACSSGW